jgi:hypothetical protein
VTTEHSKTCEKVKAMGYAPGNTIHIYRERFEVFSDPFLEGNGIALQVKLIRNGEKRVLQLPATIPQSIKH